MRVIESSKHSKIFNLKLVASFHGLRNVSLADFRNFSTSVGEGKRDSFLRDRDSFLVRRRLSEQSRSHQVKLQSKPGVEVEVNLQ